MRWERDTGVYFRHRIVESVCAGMKVPDIGMVHDARRALPLRGVRWRQRPLTVKDIISFKYADTRASASVR